MNNDVTKKTRDYSGQKNPFYGHRHSTTSRCKIAESQRERYQKTKELLQLKSLSIKALDKRRDTPE